MRHQNMVIYQIYPKSFKDTNGDGLGDLRGIIEKLDYLQDLGVDMLWLCPIYPSPQRDNGYDVSDYTAIHPDYGDMDDFEELIAQADQRNLMIMLDMVFNHTSTEHEWFQKALAGDPYYQDFYYLRSPKEDGSLPTNWASKFGGPAWAAFGETDLYYLHLYDETQADLNWHNPNVRKELYKVVNFWLDKGVKGFRFDVLNVIGKSEDFIDSPKPDAPEEKTLYTDRPIVHEWIQELNRETFGQRQDILTVGEMSSTTIENGILYTHPDREELSMIFNFHHLKVDYAEGDKWTNPDFDFLELKKILNDWQKGMSEGGGWSALFWNNHDQPRANSRFGDVKNYPYESATMLATIVQLLRGTPYIYQGEEIGMTNPNYSHIDQYNDVETHNNYKILLDKGLSEDEAMEIIQAKSRDNSRTPMQWNNEKHAGFSEGEPWLEVASNYPEINAESELERDGIYRYYQALIRLRKTNQTIQYGSYKGFLLDHPQVMAYMREYQDEQIFVLGNFYGEVITVDLPLDIAEGQRAEKLIGNGSLDTWSKQVTLAPYECIVWKIS